MADSQGHYDDFLTARRAELLERIAAAARRAGRDPSEVTLQAVSKTVDVEQVLAAARAGYRVFAENRPQELSRKVSGIAGHALGPELRYDLIGNLQTNKINQVLAAAPALIQSVSSANLAQAIAKRAANRDVCARVLLEVNVSGERSKSGFAPDELRGELEGVLGLDGIQVVGLMAMAPAHDPEAARRTFAGLRSLADELAGRGLRSQVLSCGMSDDFEIAVEEGSTLVRLGRVVFSPEYSLG